MIDISESERRQAFSIWLRTGRSPSVRNADRIEFKFNPWRDSENGRSPSSVLAVVMAVGGMRAAAARSVQEIGRLGHLDRSRRTRQAGPPQRPDAVYLSGQQRGVFQSIGSQISAPGTWAGGGFTGGGGCSSVERERQEPGDRQSRNFVRAHPAVRRQPSFLRGRPAAAGTASARPASTSRER